jgi:periplasmic protein TonB
MDETAIFTGAVLTRHRRSDSLRRAIPFAAAAIFYIGLAAAILLSQLLVVESIDTPKAAYDVIPVYHGARLPSAGMNAPGEKANSEGGARPDAHAARPSPPPTRPVVVPLAPPTSETTEGLEADSGSSSLGSGPGPGTGTDGSSDGEGGPGCEGCQGDGRGSRTGPAGPSYYGEDDPRITPPVVILGSRRLPDYPDLARRVGVEGTVILLINIESDGRVGAVEVLRSPDLRYGFDLAAIEAVRQWRYRPALLQGRPVAVQATVMVEFTISR